MSLSICAHPVGSNSVYSIFLRIFKAGFMRDSGLDFFSLCHALVLALYWPQKLGWKVLSYPLFSKRLWVVIPLLFHRIYQWNHESEVFIEWKFLIMNRIHYVLRRLLRFSVLSYINFSRTLSTSPKLAHFWHTVIPNTLLLSL